VQLTCILACWPFFWPSLDNTDSTAVHTESTLPVSTLYVLRLTPT
jgi:hypothetical protein